MKSQRNKKTLTLENCTLLGIKKGVRKTTILYDLYFVYNIPLSDNITSYIQILGYDKEKKDFQIGQKYTLIFNVIDASKSAICYYVDSLFLSKEHHSLYDFRLKTENSDYYTIIDVNSIPLGKITMNMNTCVDFIIK